MDTNENIGNTINDSTTEVWRRYDLRRGREALDAEGGLTRQCIEPVCGHAEFYLNSADIAFFAGRGLTLPLRCKDCRARRRAMRTWAEQR